LLAVFSALALAESFQGRLVDANCFDQQKSVATCDPSGSTTMFSLVVANKPYKLDALGDSKAAEAIKNRADRAGDPTKPPSTQVMAKITGSKDGDGILKVETVELQ
jgi:hypothetical protein